MATSYSSGYTHTPKLQKAGSLSRPKPTKKMSSSNSKHKTVQVSLEVKVERAKGFQAFFVPLARNLPPAPPSSPVLAHREPGENYFSGWDKDKNRQNDQWVEDITGDASGAMDVDGQ